ncbi:MAG: glycosyltransferase [Chitinophagaceae bacterium]|nr:glycosyltransferase [Chitinophagaceae bacterium]
MQQVIIIGPAHPLRGGLATFNHRLAKEFQQQGFDCLITSFSLQYPSSLFPGKTQYTNEPPPAGIKICTLINSVNPFSWIRVGRILKNLKADIIVVRFWLPFMGPSLGTILRIVKKNRHTKIICIADNVIPHEKRFGDKSFTKYFLKACDGFITMSEKVLLDLHQLVPKESKKICLVHHPLYDTFGEKISKEKAREHLKLDQGQKIILFFGFIRKYKGLELLLEAMSDERIKKENIKLLVAGEFYENEEPYMQLIRKKDLKNSVVLKTSFIPDSEVKYYLCAADCVVQPYKNATQSGVTPLAYHFEKPIIVTNVGGLPSLVPHGKVGLVCEANPKSIADAVLKFYELGEEKFIMHVRTEKQKYSWDNLVNAVNEIAEGITER